MFDFSRRTALVTGGGQGMGRAISTTLARYGASVAVTDVDLASAEETAASIRAAGGDARAWTHDVADWDASHEVVAEVEKELGPIDILVNNAGISRRLPFLDTERSEWERIVSVNLTGPFATMHAVLPGMIERRSGRVVNIGSISSKAAYADFSHYSATKFGVLGLTQAVAAEVAPYGITANTVCPGVVDTPLKARLIEEMVERGEQFTTYEEAQKWYDDMLPQGEGQTPEDVAEMVAYLASDLGRHITAASFHVDGGMVPR